MERKLIAYAKTFDTGKSEIDRNLALKLAHTFRVREEARKITEAENLSPALHLRAALLHDLSRFEQFARFQSFNDAVSFDHGDRSAELAKELGFLGDLAPDEAEDVLSAIRAHNKVEIPAGLNPRALEIARVLRDADKLDILPILLDHMKDPENEAITFGLSSNRVEFSAKVSEALAKRKSPRHKDMETVSDFVAAKLVWVYDLNFAWSRREFLRRGYLEELMKYLPRTPQVEELYRDALTICQA